MKVPKQVEPVIRISAPVKSAMGLGDAIKKVTIAVGIDPCKGCQRRATVLNRWIGFKPIAGKK